MATLCDCLLEVMRPPPTPAPRTHYFAKHEVTLAFLILSVKAISAQKAKLHSTTKY